MKLDIKICGLKTEEAVDKVVSLGATHIGFIFFPKSPRNIEPSDAGRLADRVRGRVKIVAVTVNADNDTLDEIVDQLSPDILQLHGSETPERVLNVKAVYGLPVMKALSVRDADDLKKVEPYIGIADRFLFDAKPPGGLGAAGRQWRLLRLDADAALDADSVDYMLSGGLNKDNLAEAMRQDRAPGIDISVRRRERTRASRICGLIEEFFEAVAEKRLRVDSRTAGSGK
jgi:phosphoribosylanthranilate isomerase